MVRLFSRWFGTRSLDSFDTAMTRERLIQAARIVIIDDETPLIIEELKSAGFAVDHDKSGSDLKRIDAQIYDVAIVDYHGVGQKLGGAQGLELVRYIRRVSPRTRVIAYTSRSLSATESEFFRKSHTVLPKDLGLGDSLALIEGEIRKSFSKEHLLEALLAKLEVTGPEQREEAHNALVKALTKNSEPSFREYVKNAVGVVAAKSVDVIIDHVFN
jgi:CheY-like chemotaxis protein